MASPTPIAANLRGELTPAQVRVLHVLARGQKFQSAAETLGVSARTIEQHVQQLKTVTKHKNLFQLGMWYQYHYPNGEAS